MKIQHDTFNIYAYGKDKVKIVYFKRRAVFPEKYEYNPLLPELIDIPAKFRQIYANSVIYGEASLHFGEVEKPVKIVDNSPNEKRLANNISRARSRIFELAYCNEFNYFCTFTQSADLRVDRFDLSAFIKDLGQFIRNINRTRLSNPIKYLLIPEPHLNSQKKENRGAWHMHGLLMGLTADDLREFSTKDKIPLKLKNRIKNGEKIYNWEQYSRKFGYFTCTPINSKEGCSKYLTKYITKDLSLSAIESGHHLFYASQGLKGRETVSKKLSANIDKCPVNEWDYENDYVKVKWLDLKSDLSDSKI